MYKIRNFGNNQMCHSLDELKDRLQDYCGQSVAVEYEAEETLLKKVVFIDITDKGRIFKTYGDKAPFNIHDFNGASLTKGQGDGTDA